jgi:hypothetical protein
LEIEDTRTLDLCLNNGTYNLEEEKIVSDQRIASLKEYTYTPCLSHLNGARVVSFLSVRVYLAPHHHPYPYGLWSG